MRLVSFVGGFGRVDGPDVIQMGVDLVPWLAGEPARESAPRRLADVVLLAPVPLPGKIVCVGLNYRDHAAETGKPVPTEPGRRGSAPVRPSTTWPATPA